MISVCITCHNKEEYLEEAIQSLIDQTLQPTEIIIVHDGCESFAVHDNAINIIHVTAKGVQKARDAGFKQSTQPYVLFLDGDDKLEPVFLEKSLNINTDIAYPNLLWWFNHTRYTGTNRLDVTKGRATPEKMININCVTTTSLMKREVYQDIGGFPDVEIFEDWVFFLHAMQKGYKFKHTDTYLWYRQTKDSRNRQDKEKKKKVAQLVKDTFEVKGKTLCLK